MVKNSRAKDGYTGICKVCKNQYYEEHKEEILKKQAVYRDENREEKHARDREYGEKNKEKIKEKCAKWYHNNREYVMSKSKQYYEEHKEEINKTALNYKRKRLAEDPVFRLICNLRSRVKNAIKADSGEKAEKTMELLGCSVQHVRYHIKSQFTEGMTWENYGEWHVDHVRPCASFNLEDPEEQKKCFHWTNLQPLWAIDNIRKGAKT